MSSTCRSIRIGGAHTFASSAASAAAVTISETVAPVWTIWAEWLRPVSTGPMTVPPPNCCSSLAEIPALWRAGLSSALAGPEVRSRVYSRLLA